MDRNHCHEQDLRDEELSRPTTHQLGGEQACALPASQGPSLGMVFLHQQLSKQHLQGTAQKRVSDSSEQKNCLAPHLFAGNIIMLSQLF